MTITLTDMRDALKGQNKADEAIFWFCNAWHSGRRSDLYRVLCELSQFAPRLHIQRQIKVDPELMYCLDVLGKMYERAYGPPQEYQLQRVHIRDVEEGDVLIHCREPKPDPQTGRYPQEFVCIEGGWPCRVYKHIGDLTVACVEGPHGAGHHKLPVDRDGYVIGFWR